MGFLIRQMKTAIFVDVQNIYYTTRDIFGRSFDYKKFWDQIESKSKIITANAYAIDRQDEKQKKFQYALQSIGFNVKLKPYINRSDGSTKGDWDVGIAIDIIESAEEVERIILLSGDGDFDILVKKVIEKFKCVVDVFGVKELTADSLISSASSFHPIGITQLV
tara:strand:- start:1743 stop:2234 length:492 start_codon:yes stop_codon:yes gene_type:complete